MAKKSLSIEGRVVRAGRWVIDFTVTDYVAQTTTRHRKDFGLNAVKDLDLRERIAEHICTHLESFVLDPPRAAVKRAEGPTIAEALSEAVEIKKGRTRKDTFKSYRSISRSLTKYLHQAGGDSGQVSKFSSRDAQRYFDWLRAQKTYSTTTVNNHLGILKSLWSEIVARHEGVTNPWTTLKKDRQEPKQRRMFTPEERATVGAYIFQEDYWLFRAVLLQYYCYIRPAEITRLRFKDFDFERGTVLVHEASAKNGKRRHVTLPASIMPYFVDGRFERMPVAFFVFGAKWVPNPEKHLTRDMMYRRHKEHLLHLRRVGKLADITGLTWYSWKDTGISTHVHLTPPISTRNQAGHHDLEITMKYYHEPEVNKDYQSLPHNLFDHV